VHRHYLFQGLAWASFLGLLGTLLYVFLSVFMMCCSFKSLSHPMRGFGRGWMCGAALYSIFLILTTTLHLKSFTWAIDSWNAAGIYHVNLSLINATVVFGAMSAVLFLVLMILLHSWRDAHVEIYSRETGYPAGP
jgi:hypothetical protein